MSVNGSIRPLRSLLVVLAVINLVIYELKLGVMVVPSETERNSSWQENEVEEITSSNHTLASKEPAVEIPKWMIKYKEWHASQRTSLNETNWRSRKFLIMRCLSTDYKCGGFSDRLHSVPMALKFANAENRIFLIYWDRPAPLEEFLVPPPHGLDWRMPDFLLHNHSFGKRPSIHRTLSLQRWDNSNKAVLDMVHQSHDHGQAYYDEHLAPGEDNFDMAFRGIWMSLFMPAEPVQELIDQNLEKLGLKPGEYVTSHIRALYHKDVTQQTLLVENAVRCASELMPGPIFVASDSDKATQHAIDYGKQLNTTITARISDTPPLHLDRGGSFLANSDDWKKHSAAEYYETFVDVYLLANAQCSAIHKGGYGRLGNLLSHNVSCVMLHHQHTCEWNDGASNGTATSTVHQR